MRIMLDTNILVSAIFFPSTQTRTLVCEIARNHHFVLCDYVLKELRLVVKRKFPAKEASLEKFFSSLRFELINTPEYGDYVDIPSTRDHKDTPILAAAIKNNVDVFITSDKDFLVLNIGRPQIMSMTEFLYRFA